jgi:ABC-2 type transport system ATP-binding protein
VTAIVEVNDLSKRFSEEVLAVDKISFSVEEGEIFGFLGPNGAGKSTTIDMLTTLLQPTGGSGKIAGVDISKDPDKVRQIIGLVPQDLTVDDELTGRENMYLMSDLYNVPKNKAKLDIEDLLKVINLEEAADRKVKTYSGGMRKRLELAEGLIHHPRILFLDEPTLGLDIQTRTTIWKYIKDLKAKHNITVFLTTHYLEEADGLCDRIGIIDHGKIIALDTPITLKSVVGGDVIDLKVNGEKDLTDLIKAVPGVTEVKKEDGSYRVKSSNGEAVLPNVLRSVWESGQVVSGVALHRPSLDQAFLKYTGRSLRDAEQASTFDKRVAAIAARRRA